MYDHIGVKVNVYTKLILNRAEELIQQRRWPILNFDEYPIIYYSYIHCLRLLLNSFIESNHHI